MKRPVRNLSWRDTQEFQKALEECGEGFASQDFESSLNHQWHPVLRILKSIWDGISGTISFYEAQRERVPVVCSLCMTMYVGPEKLNGVKWSTAVCKRLRETFRLSGFIRSKVFCCNACYTGLTHPVPRRLPRHVDCFAHVFGYLTVLEKAAIARVRCCLRIYAGGVLHGSVTCLKNDWFRRARLPNDDTLGVLYRKESNDGISDFFMNAGRVHACLTYLKEK